MADSLPSLERLADIDEVAATFVYNGVTGKILGRVAPEHYSDNALSQIGQRLMTITQLDAVIDCQASECRFSYENFYVWTRRFGRDYWLILFMDAGANARLLRQPVNLAVVNMEKGVIAAEEEIAREEGHSELAEAARMAERAMYKMEGQDSNGYFARLELMTYYFVGPISEEILELACREMEAELPLTDGDVMREMVKRCAAHMQAEDKRNHYLEIAEDQIQRMELEMAEAAKPKK